MKVSILFVVFVFSTLLAIDAIRSPPREERKQLAGPPSEFAGMIIPDPSKAALRADSTLVPFYLTASRNGETWSWSDNYPIDTPDSITVSVLSPFKDDLTFYLKSPSATTFQQIDKSVFEGPLSVGKAFPVGSFGIDGNVVPSYSYTFYQPEMGSWGITINTTKDLKPLHPGLPHGYLILDNQSPYKLLSHLNTYELEVGQEVGLVVRMFSENQMDAEEDLPTALRDIITTAEMAVILPNGNEITVPMHDDGQHYDLAADDGVYGATIVAHSPGTYVFQPIISGTLPEGQNFMRSTSHLVGVSPPEMTLTGLAYYKYDSVTGIVSFELDVDIVSEGTLENPDLTVRAYAEVWGSDSQKIHYLPIAWVQAMVDPEDHKTFGKALRLDLNEAWIKKAGLIPPFQLRNVVLQERDLNSILSSRSEILVEAEPSNANNVVIHGETGLMKSLMKLYRNVDYPKIAATMPITEEMKWGPRPARFSKMNNSSLTAAGGKLILVHGYCSGQVWDVNQFTNAIEFKDYSASRSQAQFAEMINQFAQKNGITSCGIVAHSQGGLASLHLKTYSWSCLDTASSGRLIQSVGSPYKGCSLAGSLAAIGSIFGVGCSSNTDLATSGAQLWLSKIPVETQHTVYYYTTTYDTSWFLAPACVTASGMVLYTPNDGTCEIKFSQPDKGGNNMGTKASFCHTDGMNYPPQCKDATRNTEMNSKAAR